MGFIVNPLGAWPNGKIYYIVGDNYDTVKPEKGFQVTRMRAMTKTMVRWQDVVNYSAAREIIEFVEVFGEDAQPNLIRLKFGTPGTGGDKTIANRTGLYVGDRPGGHSPLTLNDDLENYPHEVGHLIGLGHEHMRPDGGLTASAKLAGFQKEIPEKLIALEQGKCVQIGKYDFASIMHYKGTAIKSKFDGTDSWNAQPINDKRDRDDVINGTWLPSQGDIHAIVFRYG